MTPQPYHLRLAACHRCPRHDRAGTCTVSGQDIRLHAERNACPIGQFDGLPTDEAAHERSILRGMIGIAQAVAKVGQAEPAVIARRRVICRGCEHAVPSAIGTLKCGLCGCQLWAKTELAAQKCPKGKW